MAHCSSPKAAFPALPTRGRPMTSVCTFVKKKKREKEMLFKEAEQEVLERLLTRK